MRFKSYFKKTTISSVLASCVLTGGCVKLGPNFTQPDAPLTPTWIDQGARRVPIKSSDQSDWWTVFDDPSLTKLIEHAYRENLTLRIAGIRVLEARAQLGIAIGDQFPQLQEARGGTDQAELSENEPNHSPMLDTSFRDVNLGLDAAWELDFWGRFRRGIEAADANLLGEIASYDDVLVTLTADVASTYVLTRTFEERLGLARENVAIQEESLRIAEVRFENGITTDLDVHQARTLLTNTRALIPSLEIGLRRAKHALSTLLGMPPGELQTLLGGAGRIPTAPTEAAVGIPADLLRRRPDIRQAELQAAAQSARIGIAKADLYPHFSLTGFAGLRSSDTGTSDLGDLFDGASFEAGFGPSFRWNILNYGRIKNLVRVEDARFQQSIVNYQNTVLRAAQEVEDGLVGFLRGQERVEFLAQSVEAARESVDLALVQYRDGIADYTRVLNTQESLVGQQDAYTESRGDFVRSLIATYKALGGGWQVRVGREFVPSTTKDEMAKRTDWGDLQAEPVQAEDRNNTLFRTPDW